MIRDEFIHMLEENLEPDAEMDFLVVDVNMPLVAFLKIKDVCMNVDVDDPNNYNRGGVVFKIEKVIYE